VGEVPAGVVQLVSGKMAFSKWKMIKITFFAFALFLSLGGCSLKNQKLFLSLPNTTEAKNPAQELFLKIFSYWGVRLSHEEIEKIIPTTLDAPWIMRIIPAPLDIAGLESFCKEKDLLCLFPVVDLKTIKSLLEHNFPIVGSWIEEDFAPGWGSIIYDNRWSYIINGFDDSKGKIYVLIPPHKKVVEYPSSTFPSLWWAGRRDNIALLIVPASKLPILRKIIPEEALEKGRALIQLFKAERKLLSKAKAYEERIKSIKDCLEARKKIASMFPKWAFANYLYGYPLFMTGGGKEGLNYLEKARRLEPSSFYHLALASAYAEAGELEKAWEEMRECERKDGKHSLVYLFMLSYLHKKEGKVEEGIKYIRKNMESLSDKDPLKMGLRQVYAFLKFEEGKPEEAMKEISAVAERYRIPSLYSVLFREYVKLSMLKEAKRVIEISGLGREAFEPELQFVFAPNIKEKIKIMRKISKSHYVTKHLLFACLESGNWKEAERLLSSDRNLDLKYLLAIPPDYVFIGPPINYIESAEVLTAKGIIEYQRGNKEKAKELFQRAIEYSEMPLSLFAPQLAEAVLTPKAYLGMIFYEEGKEELARKYLKEAFSKKVPFLGDDEAKPVAQKLGISVR
jgi:tetratricopeptide (TPR) repeat protein